MPRNLGRLRYARRRFSLFQGVAFDMNDSSENGRATCRGCAASAWDELRIPRNLGRLRYTRRRFSLFQDVAVAKRHEPRLRVSRQTGKMLNPSYSSRAPD